MTDPARPHHQPIDPAARGLRSTIVGIAANALLAAVKGLAGYFGNSYALIADAIESSTDVVSSFVVWAGLKISTRPPDADHPYGHGKAEPLTAIVVSVALLIAAATIAAQSVREIVTPHHAPAPFTLAVLVLVVITKETLFRWVFDVGKGIGSLAVKSDAWHHRSDAMTSAAAFIGIAIALVGGEGYESADDWAALVAAAIIIFNASRILRPAVAEVMDAAPPEQTEIDVRKVARNVEGVIALEKCLIRKMGVSYYVDLHVTVDGSLTVRDGHDIARNVRHTVRTFCPQVAEVLVHIEPADLMEEQALR